MGIRVFLVVAVGFTPVVAVIAWKYDLTSKGFLRDRQDVALERQSVLHNAIGPTAASLPRRRDGRSILEASWTGDEGEKIKRRFAAAFVIGRDYQAEVRLCDDRVSRRHVKVYPQGDDWYLQDLESLNGTYIGNKTVDVRKITSFRRTSQRHTLRRQRMRANVSCRPVLTQVAGNNTSRKSLPGRRTIDQPPAICARKRALHQHSRKIQRNWTR